MGRACPARACMAGTAAVGQRRAEHVPALPGGKGRTSGVRKAALHPALRRRLPPKGEGRALFMRIRRKLVVAVFLFGVQTQQLEARENQQCRNDNIRYAGDDVVGVAVAHKIAQQRIEPV